MLKIGLTGGIGCGKSTVAELFKLKGITIVDADKIARDVVAPGAKALTEIASKFGEEVLLPSGELNRQLLREKVFSDQKSLEWLNQLLHPQIRQQLINQAESASSPYVILDIPLLFENNLASIVDRVLVVDIPETEQIKRVISRDSVSEDSVRSIINRQVSRAHRLSHADDILDNTVNQKSLEKSVEELHQKFLSLSKL